MDRSDELIAEVRRICGRADLRTSDPYDIWMTGLGFYVKDLFNRSRVLGMLPAAVMTLLDMYPNNRLRLFYKRREYPIARAWASLILINTYRLTRNPADLEWARVHLDWLCAHSCQGFSGPCWGLGFDYAVSADLHYDRNMPLSTMTPYVLEALVAYEEETNNDHYVETIRGIHAFFDNDLVVMEETDTWLVTSYSAKRDRRVINAVSYTMYSYCLLLPYIADDARDRAERRIAKLFAFIKMSQRPDGSWLYSPDGNSFVDCFHSCIVVKNLIKSGHRFSSIESKDCIDSGYDYIKREFRVASSGLFRRFSVANKPSLVRYDLYDNAELLNLAVLMKDSEVANTLANAIAKTFRSEGRIFSQVDRFGLRQNVDTLRWAVLPYVYALTTMALNAVYPGENARTN